MLLYIGQSSLTVSFWSPFYCPQHVCVMCIQSSYLSVCLLLMEFSSSIPQQFPVFQDEGTAPGYKRKVGEPPVMIDRTKTKTKALNPRWFSLTSKQCVIMCVVACRYKELEEKLDCIQKSSAHRDRAEAQLKLKEKECAQVHSKHYFSASSGLLRFIIKAL